MDPARGRRAKGSRAKSEAGSITRASREVRVGVTPLAAITTDAQPLELSRPDYAEFASICFWAPSTTMRHHRCRCMGRGRPRCAQRRSDPIGGKSASSFGSSPKAPNLRDIRIHELRHRGATIRITIGVPNPIVRKIAGQPVGVPLRSGTGMSCSRLTPDSHTRTPTNAQLRCIGVARLFRTDCGTS